MSSLRPGSRPDGSDPGGAEAEATAEAEAGRTRKFRQAAFTYLHVAILYEAAVFILWREGLLPAARGPAWVWLLIGAAITAVVFWGLWSWRNRWFARVIWALHSLRLPALIGAAFFPAPDASIPTAFYAFALVVVLFNLAMLARAGWNL